MQFVCPQWLHSHWQRQAPANDQTCLSGQPILFGVLQIPCDGIGQELGESFRIPPGQGPDFEVLINDRLIIASTDEFDVSCEAARAGAETNQAFFNNAPLLVFQDAAFKERGLGSIGSVYYLVLANELFSDPLLLQS